MKMLRFLKTLNLDIHARNVGFYLILAMFENQKILEKKLPKWH